MSATLTIAATEVRLGVRNRWILLGTVILTLLALALALIGSTPAGTLKASPLAVTIVSLASLGVYLIPLLALLLAYDAIIGEIERGTMLLLFTYPLRRTSLLLGKFLGHLTVLTIVITASFAIAGLVVALGTPPTSTDMMMAGRLLGSSILLGAIFLALGYLASALANDRSGAAAIGIALWLFMVLLYDMGLLGLLSAEMVSDSFPFLLLANPGDSFRLVNLTGFDDIEMVSGLAAIGRDLPVGPSALLALMAAWVVVPLAITGGLLTRREL